MVATDEVPDEPKAHLWMAGRALQICIREIFFTGQNPDFWSKIGAHARPMAVADICPVELST